MGRVTGTVTATAGRKVSSVKSPAGDYARRPRPPRSASATEFCARAPPAHEVGRDESGEAAGAHQARPHGWSGAARGRHRVPARPDAEGRRADAPPGRAPAGAALTARPVGHGRHPANALRGGESTALALPRDESVLAGRGTPKPATTRQPVRHRRDTPRRRPESRRRRCRKLPRKPPATWPPTAAHGRTRRETLRRHDRPTTRPRGS